MTVFKARHTEFCECSVCGHYITDHYSDHCDPCFTAWRDWDESQPEPQRQLDAFEMVLGVSVDDWRAADTLPKFKALLERRDTWLALTSTATALSM